MESLPVSLQESLGQCLDWKRLEGNNSDQRFGKIHRPLVEMKGVPNLANYAKGKEIVAFATVPSQSDIQEITVLYEL